jgi:hypothetical protein
VWGCGCLGLRRYGKVVKKMVLVLMGSIAKLHLGELVEEARDIKAGPSYLPPRHWLFIRPLFVNKNRADF